MSVVLRAAQELLARQTINSEGTVYHLIPGNAPIDFIERNTLIGNGAPLDDTVPGLKAVFRLGAAECGESIAAASWAVHFYANVSVVAGSGGAWFLVKTRNGWRFWGIWCGAENPLKWRNTHCD